MEIERKFLINWEEINNLNLPLIKQAESWQGYLSAATPVGFESANAISPMDTPTIFCVSKAKASLHDRKLKKN